MTIEETWETLPHNKKYVEMDKKQWRVRYLIITAFSAVLSVKIYLTFFVIDPVVGIYSVITGSVLFGYFLLSYTKFKDPYFEAQDFYLSNRKPLVSIIIPVKNEEKFIRTCVESCANSTYTNKEIIVVDDGSSDKTPEILDELGKEENILVIHNAKNEGKKRAIEIGTESAKGEIYVFMDSDCNMAPDAVEKTVTIFISDEHIGAVTAHGRVRNVTRGNTLEKMQDTWYDGQFRIIKGAESGFSTLSCCSGAYSAYRKEAVQPFIHAWVHDKFLGKNFKFATDRRLTAYVLGAKVAKNSDDTTQSCYWKMKYSPSVRVFIGPPTTFSSLIRQQIRWRKSFIRSIFATGGVFWRRPLPIALLFYTQLGLKIFRPYIIIKSLVLLPLSGDYLTSIFYFASLVYTAMIYGVEFRLRNPGSIQWLYRPLITLLGVFVFSWLLLYAFITIRKTAWR